MNFPNGSSFASQTACLTARQKIIVRHRRPKNLLATKSKAFSASEVILQRGNITYREKDLPLLKKIRAGEIPLDDVFKMADEFDEKISAAYKNSKLPDVPDSTKIDKLLIEIYREHFAR